jgi:hypothetical protein
VSYILSIYDFIFQISMSIWRLVSRYERMLRLWILIFSAMCPILSISYFFYPEFRCDSNTICQSLRGYLNYKFDFLRYVSYLIFEYLISALHKYGVIQSISKSFSIFYVFSSLEKNLHFFAPTVSLYLSLF